MANPNHAQELFGDEPQWAETEGGALRHVETQAELSTSRLPEGERRHSSTASTSTRSTDNADGGASRGRRTRPSIISASASLATVRERDDMRVESQRRLSTQSAPVTFAPGINQPSLSPAMSSIRSERPSNLVKVGTEEKVVSSKKVLMSFSKVASRNVEKEDARKSLVNRHNIENDFQRGVLQRLRSWADTDWQGVLPYFYSWVLPAYRRTPRPHVEELKSLAKHYYPPRSEVKCHVCDFGQGRAEHTLVELGDLEEYWVVKPDWVDVRWIHAPLGLGLTHSSVEDIFLHEGETGREFQHAGRSGWPYLETEILNFRHRDNFQEMRDTWLLLHNMHELHEDLDESTWKNDRNASLHHDIDWRAGHLGMTPTFWNLVDSDMPWQLSEGLAMGAQGPKDGLKPIARHVDKQTLTTHPFYRDAQLVRNPFRTFHREDGFLLTLSPMAGVNYLDRDFSRHLAEPTDTMFGNDDASAIGHVYEAFAQNGTGSWHRRSVEWFLVYLLTEVGTTPHHFRQGCNAPSFESAYSSVIQDLKRRRYEKWRPKVTVQLVRDYLNCIDELTTVKILTHQKLDLFKVMQQDIKNFEAEDMRKGKKPDFEEGESAEERLVWAIGMVKARAECFDRLLIDLKQSMDALFQLRSIEQNELAIVSDSQNKAILVFTGVTIVFLPLSFFTSYYGMNLSSIASTPKDEYWFWKVCGSATLAIVLVVVLGAFRHNLRRLLSGRTGKSQDAMV